MVKINEYPGYFVTKEGEIFSCKVGNIIKRMACYIHKAKDRRTGYKYVTLRKAGKTYVKLVHRLVAEAFIPNPENKPQINHIDGNGTNNNINNLEWVTNGENVQHSYDVLGRKAYWTGKSGADNPSSKPIIQYDKDMNIVAEYSSARLAEAVTGFGHKPICAALTGEAKTYKGFNWRFKGRETEWVYKRNWKKYQVSSKSN